MVFLVYVKSTVFYGNVNNATKQEIKLVMHFNEGNLPVMYLGIHLDSNRINSSDCSVLLDNVKN